MLFNHVLNYPTWIGMIPRKVILLRKKNLKIFEKYSDRIFQSFWNSLCHYKPYRVCAELGDVYSSTSFSGLADLLEFVGNQTEEDRPDEWAKIKEHLSVIAFMIQAAGKSFLMIYCNHRNNYAMFTRFNERFNIIKMDRTKVVFFSEYFMVIPSVRKSGMKFYGHFLGLN